MYIACKLSYHHGFSRHQKPLQSGTGLTPDFETGIKTPFKQPVVGIVPVTGCLVSFEYGYGYNK